MIRKTLPLVFALGALLLTAPTLSLGNETTDSIKAAATDAKDSTVDALQVLGEKLDDSSLTAEVKARILLTKGLDTMDIHVETKDSVVVLSGIVESSVQVALAEQVAKDVKGVKSVVNNLKTAD